MKASNEFYDDTTNELTASRRYNATASEVNSSDTGAATGFFSDPSNKPIISTVFVIIGIAMAMAYLLFRAGKIVSCFPG